MAVESHIRYHIWTIGCQMNQAESARIAGRLDAAGLEQVPHIDQADLVVLNTCVIRQSAEDKVLGTLGLLKGLRQRRPYLSIVVTGCFVDSNGQELRSRFPHVDLFCRPGDYWSLEDWLCRRTRHGTGQGLLSSPDAHPLPKRERDHTGRQVPTAYVPIIQGCDRFCSYCIVPYRRGREASRPLTEVVDEVRRLVARGVREVTLLGQNVASYGHDLRPVVGLADLLHAVNEVDGLARIRFLTAHPADVDDRLVDAVASLEKVCEHFDVPVQSGDDYVLSRMRRGYSVDQFRALVRSMRAQIPGVSLSTDVIVGFPGETDEQFAHTYSLLEEQKFDVVHSAAYSVRPGTIAARRYLDDVPPETKRQRLHKVESLHGQTARSLNERYLDSVVEILVEGRKQHRWYGRTRTDKLVFFESEDDLLGRLAAVRITESGPWALRGVMEAAEA